MRGVFFKHPFQGRVGSHRQPEKLRRPSTSLPEKSDDQKPHAWSSCAPTLHMWARGGLFRLWPPPPISSGADKTSSVLGFSVWYLDLLFLVIFVSNNPLCLGFLQDFLNLCLLKILSGPDILSLASSRVNQQIRSLFRRQKWPQ